MQPTPKAKKSSVRNLDPSQLSPTMRALNPHLFEPVADMPNESHTDFEARQKRAEPKVGKRRGAMNKTEARFARLLDARLERGEILSYEYEGITLRWPDGMRYTPDFAAVREMV